MRNRLLSSLFFVLLSIVFSPVSGQNKLIEITNANGKAELPFELVNNFIVVDITLNGFLPLKFIFDTGAENTILTRSTFNGFVDIDYSRKIKLFGSDLKNDITAYIARRVNIDIGDNLKIAQQTMLVLEQDYFHFENYTGVDIDGILGADILRRFVVYINFKRSIITFQDPSRFKKPRSSYIKANVEFHRYKPYLYLSSEISTNNDYELKLLMDTGASLAILLYTFGDSLFQLPEHLIRSNLGFGLGGSIEGYIGRLRRLSIANQHLENIVTNFQDVPFNEFQDSIFLNDRNGIVGNVVLSRFNLIIDYINETLYLQARKQFNRKFKFDRSGINLVALGTNHNKFIVLEVIKGSPADLAGIQKGDEIRSINGVSTFFKSLESLIRAFQKKEGKKMRILIKRNEERIYFEFILKDLI